mmetsp:Transcript_7263/g.21433  ORF Transcript_7263/g.21433 Transcript_7263/m.21433 type:complete len:291 (-) Transcript_7263:364-1236(-)
MAETQFITTTDGVKLAYDTFGKTGPVIVLIHGWSGSRHYFERNTQVLGRTCRVYALDLRFHGDSERPPWGYHVARLAADLRDFLTALDLELVTVVGCSMGSSIIWSHFELFGDARISKAVFVDQTPLQNLAEDWTLGSKGCYDVASLTRCQMQLRYDFLTVAQGNCECCLSKNLGEEVCQVLCRETLKADNEALAKVMADHTQLDWRPVLPQIRVPCLNMIGELSGCFPEAGCRVVSERIPNCQTVVFEGCNHWLYLEEPDAFNRLLRDFATGGRPAVASVTRVPCSPES